MGTWGPGNFENDGAHDFANDLVRELTERIAKTFRRKYGADLDEDRLAELRRAAQKRR